MGQRITGPALLLTILLALAPVWAQPAPEPAHESRRAWLGCWTRDGDDGSLAVVALYPSGPAERAGLRVGDLLLSMNDRKINDQATLATWLAELEPGEVTRFAVLRDGVELPIEIPLGELADAVVRVSPVVAPDPAVVVSDEDSPFPVQWGFRGQRWIGLELVDLTAELRKHYGADSESGILVTRVEPHGVGSEMGLAVGDVVIAAEGEPIRSVSEFDRRLTWYTSRVVTLKVIRDERTLTLVEEEGTRRRIVIERRRRDREAHIRKEILRLQKRIDSLEHQLERLDSGDP